MRLPFHAPLRIDLTKFMPSHAPVFTGILLMSSWDCVLFSSGLVEESDLWGVLREMFVVMLIGQAGSI